MTKRVVCRAKKPAKRKAPRVKALPKLQVPDSCRYLGRFVVGFVQ